MKHNVVFLCLALWSVARAQDGGWKVVSTEVVRTQIVDGKEIEISRTITYADGVQHQEATEQVTEQATEQAREEVAPNVESTKVDPKVEPSPPAVTVKIEPAIVKVEPEQAEEPAIKEEPKKETVNLKLNTPASFVVPKQILLTCPSPTVSPSEARMVRLDGKLVPLIKRGDPEPPNNAFVYEDLLNQVGATTSSCAPSG